MDTPKVLTLDEALALVRRYKQVITSRFTKEPLVYLFGSYSKGTANPWSDLDVAVIVPSLEGIDWLELSADLWHDVDKVSLLIEPVLMSQEEDTILYRDVMRTGIAAGWGNNAIRLRKKCPNRLEVSGIIRIFAAKNRSLTGLIQLANVWRRPLRG